jgi:hypothetical protein
MDGSDGLTWTGCRRTVIRMSSEEVITPYCSLNQTINAFLSKQHDNYLDAVRDPFPTTYVPITIHVER